MEIDKDQRFSLGNFKLTYLRDQEELAGEI